MKKVSLEDSVVDPITKALSRVKHYQNASSIGSRDVICFNS